MQKTIGILGVCLGLAACGPLSLTGPQATATDAAQTRPQSRPEVLETAQRRPPASARTAEEFDTTTEEERVAAASPASEAQERSLGTTVVSLGDPARPGFWLETPLVSSVVTGRVVNPENGQSSQVELSPSESGSRMSLSAMRLIGVPLTGLAEVQVFSGG